MQILISSVQNTNGVSVIIFVFFFFFLISFLWLCPRGFTYDIHVSSCYIFIVLVVIKMCFKELEEQQTRNWKMRKSKWGKYEKEHTNIILSINLNNRFVNKMCLFSFHRALDDVFKCFVLIKSKIKSNQIQTHSVFLLCMPYKGLKSSLFYFNKISNDHLIVKIIVCHNLLILSAVIVRHFCKKSMHKRSLWIFFCLVIWSMLPELKCQVQFWFAFLRCSWRQLKS